MKKGILTSKFILREILKVDEQGLFEIHSDLEVHKYLGNNPIKDFSEAEDII